MFAYTSSSDIALGSSNFKRAFRINRVLLCLFSCLAVLGNGMEWHNPSFITANRDPMLVKSLKKKPRVSWRKVGYRILIMTLTPGRPRELPLTFRSAWSTWSGCFPSSFRNQFYKTNTENQIFAKNIIIDFSLRNVSQRTLVYFFLLESWLRNTVKFKSLYQSRVWELVNYCPLPDSLRSTWGFVCFEFGSLR